MSEAVPSEAEMQVYVRERRNWGRWGEKDQAGAVNLITPEKRKQAASLVQSGRSLSLSRPFPKTPAPNNPNPGQHWMRRLSLPHGAAGAIDYYGISYHGWSTTHIDALCHTWDADGLWNGGRPEDVESTGARWGAIDNWAQGIVTRGVLLDVPAFRGAPFVTLEEPVTGDELERIARAEGVEVQAGDALVVHSGREAYDRAGQQPWGTPGTPSPGLHASCLRFLREHDIAVLVWDMMDAPRQPDLPWGVHTAIFAFGVALVDNALLEPLAAACAEEGRYDFMLTLAPLVVEGGTGSPLNPLALF